MNVHRATAVFAILLMIASASRAAEAQVILGHANNDGRLLLGELACTACHAPAKAADLLTSRRGIPLNTVGQRVLPAAITSLITDPQTSKPGTPMPDLLAALLPAEKSAAAENLTHYLISLSGPMQSTPRGVSEIAIKRGQDLYHTIGCIACHAPMIAPPAGEDEEPKDPTKRPIPKLETPSVPLGDLAAKYTVESLADFLRDPLKTRPAGRMPSMNLSASESADLAAYLLRDQLDKKTPLAARGLRFAYFEAEFKALGNAVKGKSHDEGTSLEIGLGPAKRTDHFALKFTGDLEAPADGKYSFHFEADDSVEMKINNKIVPLPKPDPKKRPNTAEGSVTLKKGKHAIEIIYKQNDNEKILTATWMPPGETAYAPIPESALSHAGFKMTPKTATAFIVDAAKAAAGKELFAKIGCASCHDTGDKTAPPTTLAAKPLLDLNPNAKNTCLDESPSPGRPAYALSPKQRAALRTALVDLKSASPLDVKTIVAQTLSALNCLACHSRDGAGGPEVTRALYFTPVEEMDLGDEGRLPPHLNEAGAKLKTAALGQILVTGLRVRPYMSTRMPSFGKDNISHLPAALAAADAPKVPAHTPLATTPQLIDEGRRLVGVNGLGCVQCHSWGTLKSLGLPSVNLSQAPDRLTPGYFHAYLAEPNRWRPGTRMPPFWAPGVKVLPEIQGGDPDKQMDAIWAYLSQGANAGMPAGMEPSDKSMLVPVDEPIVFRTFVDKLGAHAIAVGFRQKTHVIFDSMQVRMAAAWPGDFIKSDSAWNGRGGNYAGLPSQNVLQLPPGPAFASLDSQSTPWPAYDPSNKTSPEGFRFTGYRFDKARNPTFLYRFNNIEIEETPTAMFSAEGKGHVIRKLKLTSATPVKDIWFRAAIGKDITTAKDGEFEIDKKIKCTLRPSNPDSTIRATLNGKDPAKEIVVPLKWTPKGTGVESELEIELVW